MSRPEKYIVMVWLALLTALDIMLVRLMLELVEVVTLNADKLMEMFFFITGQVNA